MPQLGFGVCVGLNPNLNLGAPGNTVDTSYSPGLLTMHLPAVTIMFILMKKALQRVTPVPSAFSSVSWQWVRL